MGKERGSGQSKIGRENDRKKRRKDKLPRCGGEWWYPQHVHVALGCEREESQES